MASCRCSLAIPLHCTLRLVMRQVVAAACVPCNVTKIASGYCALANVPCQSNMCVRALLCTRVSGMQMARIYFPHGGHRWPVAFSLLLGIRASQSNRNTVSSTPCGTLQQNKTHAKRFSCPHTPYLISAFCYACPSSRLHLPPAFCARECACRPRIVALCKTS